MKKRNISVIIPIYNSEETIVPVLNSIVNQTKRQYILEILIINDGSTDQSKELVDKYIGNYHGQIIIKQIEQKNSGVSVARNRGMEKATSEWIAFCDSDDIWLPDKIEHQVNIINSLKDCDILGGYVFDKPFTILFKTYEGLLQPTLLQMLIKSFPWSSTVIMKKEIYKSIGGFEVNRNYGEDMLYYISILENYHLYFDTKKIVDIGFGKRPFGETGLSGDLEAMYEGTVNILYYLKKNKRISLFQFYLFKIYYYLKHIRRILISNFKNIRND